VPKLSPPIVTVPPPLDTALAEVDEVVLTTGAASAIENGGIEQQAVGQPGAPSKLNCPVSVPATALTLTAVRTVAKPPYACGAQDTVVADVHALLPHTSAAVSEAVAVGPTAPKLSPPIVTVPPPLGAAFAGAGPLTTGAAMGGMDVRTYGSDRSGSTRRRTYRRR
jgi:hypothetical protein